MSSPSRKNDSQLAVVVIIVIVNITIVFTKKKRKKWQHTQIQTHDQKFKKHHLLHLPQSFAFRKQIGVPARRDLTNFWRTCTPAAPHLARPPQFWRSEPTGGGSQNMTQQKKHGKPRFFLASTKTCGVFVGSKNILPLPGVNISPVTQLFSAIYNDRRGPTLQVYVCKITANLTQICELRWHVKVTFLLIWYCKSLQPFGCIKMGFAHCEYMVISWKTSHLFIFSHFIHIALHESRTKTY